MRILKIVTAVALVALSGTAYAQSSAGSQSGASNLNDISVNSYGSTIPDRQTIRSAPGIAGGGASSILSCKSIGTVGLSIIGGGGLIPMPLGDGSCETRQGVVVLGSMYQATGDRTYITAADNVMCDDSRLGKAISLAGKNCPEATRQGKANARAASRNVNVAASTSAAPVQRTERRMNVNDIPRGARYSLDNGRTWQIKR